MPVLKKKLHFNKPDIHQGSNFLDNRDKKIHVPKIALVGNPNCGKTTLFNNLTGSAQYVGNWPGVTVERKEGKLRNSSMLAHIVDLPGIYSLSLYSPEEIITRNYIIDENPELIINIIDSTNLERSLYLTTQLIELEYKIVLALNMSDMLSKKGKSINYKLLEKEIGLPIIPISASKGTGMDNLINKAQEMLSTASYKYPKPKVYSPLVESVLSNIEKELKENNIYSKIRFKAIKIFEKDSLVASELALPKESQKKINMIISSICAPKNMDYEMIIADQRYKYICGICNDCINEVRSFKKNVSLSQKIDNIVSSRFFAIPIFMLIMMIIFFFTFGPVGIYLKSATEHFINIGIGSAATQVLEMFNASQWTKSLVLDAIIGGVGSVISFLPQVLILFSFLSLLEDCGYMARAVFIMDKIFSRIGLSGKAFIPLVMGFGCSVPAILGTRIMENKKVKNLTIFLIPFMSCSAKMPLYLLLASAFFPSHQFIVISAIYLLGLPLAIFTAYMFKDSLFKGENGVFVMELPEYKLPSFKNLRIHVWDRVKDFIERAGTVILSATVVIWFLQSFNTKFEFVENKSDSILSLIGNLIAPIFSICGFGDWKAAVSLASGLIAKESIVSTMSVLYSQGGGPVELGQILLNVFTPLSALSFMVFVMLYTPCVAAISAMYKEFKSVRLTIFSVIYQFLIALFVSAFVFQFGSLIQKVLT
jgi:ferrous iron transporter FeoB